MFSGENNATLLAVYRDTLNCTKWKAIYAPPFDNLLMPITSCKFNIFQIECDKKKKSHFFSRLTTLVFAVAHFLFNSNSNWNSNIKDEWANIFCANWTNVEIRKNPPPSLICMRLSNTPNPLIIRISFHENSIIDIAEQRCDNKRRKMSHEYFSIFPLSRTLSVWWRLRKSQKNIK